MNILQIIKKKKEGLSLSQEEIIFFINNITNESIPDYQTSALLMAIRINGMTEEEINFLTFAMRDSGEVADLSDISGIKVDKHSTGGVADTTTLITLPIAAACGVKIAKMSGRGLGHTGGTIDKLSSIPGYKWEQDSNQIRSIIDDCGVSLVGQSGNFAPADKILYALRDVTSTVDSLPLIASSIMSKKLASGCDALVLDVKMGSGALLESEEEARKLAKTLVQIGKAAGLKIRALVTDMNQPLGQAIGNSLEVMEACNILKTAKITPLTKVALTLAAQMIFLSGLEAVYSDAMLAAVQSLNNGSAFKKLKEMVARHGGDTDCLDNTSLLPLAPCKKEIFAPQEGYLTRIATQKLGLIAMQLGAGRATQEDKIDLGAGLWFYPRIGDFLQKGDRIATLYTSSSSLFEKAEEDLLATLKFSDKEPASRIKTIKEIYE